MRRATADENWSSLDESTYLGRVNGEQVLEYIPNSIFKAQQVG